MNDTCVLRMFVESAERACRPDTGFVSPQPGRKRDGSHILGRQDNQGNANN